MKPKEKFGMPLERKQIADQVKRARQLERENGPDTYIKDRTGKEYFYTIGGLRNLFEYFRKLKSKKVLDVGAGDGNASHEISEMQISSGLDFEVTVLRNTPQLVKYFPEGKIHITEIESLRGINDESLAGVIGVNSMAYSVSPQLAVSRLNQVLIPGGVIKSTFDDLNGSYNRSRLNFHSPEKFVELLKSIGYDVSIKKNYFSVKRDSGRNYIELSVMLAIKPGNPSAPFAKNLLELDFNDIQSNAIGQANGHPIFDVRN